MTAKQIRQREDSCCHNCPDHKPITFDAEGKAITCRQGCEKWAEHERKKARRREESRIAYLGAPESMRLERNIRKCMRDRREGRAT